jgi:hypothetical protein
MKPNQNDSVEEKEPQNVGAAVMGFAESRPFLGVHAWRSCHACPKRKSNSSNVMPPFALSTASHFIPATLFVMFMCILSPHSFCRMTSVKIML